MWLEGGKAMAQQFTWKEAVIIFDNEDFQTGFKLGRDFYFHGALHKRNEAGAVILEASEIVGLIAICDDDGHFSLDDQGDPALLEELLGMLVGYLSGPACPETWEELREWEAACTEVSPTP
jgi:hypothetical protein